MGAATAPSEDELARLLFQLFDFLFRLQEDLLHAQSSGEGRRLSGGGVLVGAALVMIFRESL
jgi:hypothetical protein